MSDEVSLHILASSATPLVDIIFIHGLTGHFKDTWSSEESSEGEKLWPLWLFDKLPTANIYSLGYPTSIISNWAKPELNLFQMCNSAIESLEIEGIGERPIILVTHSLGGIVAKQILRTCSESKDNSKKSISDLTCMVIFISTPHTGSALASIVKSLISKISTQNLQLLSNDSGFLNDLNRSYRALSDSSNIQTVSYFEQYKTKGVQVVTSESADPGVSNSVPVCIQANHIDICKPKSKNSSIFKGVCYHIKKTLRMLEEKSKNPFSFGDFTKPSETDRRELYEKLLAGNRENEYATANEYQSRFARSYCKNGLLGDAKDKHENLLDSVKQRFITHVYLPIHPANVGTSYPWP